MAFSTPSTLVELCSVEISTSLGLPKCLISAPPKPAGPSAARTAAMSTGAWNLTSTIVPPTKSMP